MSSLVLEIYVSCRCLMERGRMLEFERSAKLPPEARTSSFSEASRLLIQNCPPLTSQQEPAGAVSLVVAQDGTCSISSTAKDAFDKNPSLREHKAFIASLIVKFMLFNCILASILLDEGFNHLFLYGVALVYAVMLPLYALVLLAIPRQSLLLFCPALVLSIVSTFVLYINILVTALRYAAHRINVWSLDGAHIVLDILLVVTETLLLVQLCQTFARFVDQLQRRDGLEEEKESIVCFGLGTASLADLDLVVD